MRGLDAAVLYRQKCYCGVECAATWRSRERGRKEGGVMGHFEDDIRRVSNRQRFSGLFFLCNPNERSLYAGSPSSLDDESIAYDNLEQGINMELDAREESDRFW
jgi:hypothetical protein